MMDIVFQMTEEEKKIRNDFFNPTTNTMADASSLSNNMRLSLDPVQVKSVGVNIICVVVCF